MIKLRKIASVIKPYIESDFYIPIKIRFGHWTTIKEPTNCLEIQGNANTSLLEIGLGQTSGEIKYITLVVPPNVLSEMPIRKPRIPKEKIGLPALDMKEWKSPDYYANENIDFNVYLKDNRVLIELFPEKAVLIIINENYRFGFNAHKLLCTIEMDISTEEKTLLEESLRAKGNL